MYVTSDIFDLERIGSFRGYSWRENLLCGVAVHGSRWPGPGAAANYILESARRCNLLDKMQYAGYNLLGDPRTRSIKPKSFERLSVDGLAGGREAVSVLLKGTASAQGSERGTILFGGEASGSLRADYFPRASTPAETQRRRPFSASFIFPFGERAEVDATHIFLLSVKILGAEYGYYFIRDEQCFPSAYPAGIAPALDFSNLANEEAEEIHGWAEFAREGELWSGRGPLLRDVFAINLLSQLHIATPIKGLGTISDWIEASTSRGRLEDVGHGRLLWTLTDAELASVRPALNQAGVLFACRDRVYRSMVAD
jgi:hypothetical protein